MPQRQDSIEPKRSKDTVKKAWGGLGRNVILGDHGHDRTVGFEYGYRILLSYP